MNHDAHTHPNQTRAAITWLYIEGCWPKTPKQRFLLMLYRDGDEFECNAQHERIEYAAYNCLRRVYKTIHTAIGPTLAGVIGESTEACMNYTPETEVQP